MILGGFLPSLVCDGAQSSQSRQCCTYEFLTSRGIVTTNGNGDLSGTLRSSCIQKAVPSTRPTSSPVPCKPFSAVPSIRSEVPKHARCWSICPVIFAFGDQHIADDDNCWMFHRVTPNGATIATHSSITIQMVIKRINAFWMIRFSEIDPALAKHMQNERRLIDGKDHAFSGEELRAMSMGLFSGTRARWGSSSPIGRQNRR